MNENMPKKQKNTKAGLKISLNQTENREPFEVTVFFKNPDNEAEQEKTISITASGKLTLNIGREGRLEFFVENTKILKELEGIEGKGGEDDKALSNV